MDTIYKTTNKELKNLYQECEECWLENHKYWKHSTQIQITRAEISSEYNTRYNMKKF